MVCLGAAAWVLGVKIRVVCPEQQVAGRNRRAAAVDGWPGAHDISRRRAYRGLIGKP